MFAFQAVRSIRASIKLTTLTSNAYSTKSIFVGNIAWQTTNDALKEHFSQKVNVHSVSLPLDTLGRTKGYGFVEVDEAEYDTAFSEFDGKEFSGRTLYLKQANGRKTTY